MRWIKYLFLSKEEKECIKQLRKVEECIYGKWYSLASVRCYQLDKMIFALRGKK